MRPLLALALLALPFASAATPASQGCDGWTPAFAAPIGPDRAVYASTVFDDGSGAALYVGGAFERIGSADARFVARWNGTVWEALGSGLGQAVHALAAFDDGTGAALYAGGSFHPALGAPTAGIARWNGSSWVSVGGGIEGSVYALAVWDDGSGPALYAGGYFAEAGGAPARCIAKWNGTSWSEVGSGVTEWVTSIDVLPSGGSSSLIVGGTFTVAGNTLITPRIARWNGSAWSNLGAGLPANVHAVRVFDDGSGPRLHAAGESLVGVQRFDGATWTKIASTNQVVRALAVVDDGSGPALWAGGAFTHVSSQPMPHIARWDGSSWTAPGGGANRDVRTITDLPGAAVFAGGIFETIGGAEVNRVGVWSGGAWSAVGAGQVPIRVRDALEFDDGSGTALYVVGEFQSILGTPASGIARLRSGVWEPVGGGLEFATPGPQSLAIHDEAGQRYLVVGGRFHSAGGAPASNVARWDGTTWSALGAGLGSVGAPTVRALAVFQGELYAAGSFTESGATSVRGVARWDGNAWQPLGSGLFTDFAMSSLSDGHALAVHDDGTGAALYVGGFFSGAGTIASPHVARWDGAAWSGVGGGVSIASPSIPGGPVTALASFAGELYVAGEFQKAGAISANRIARWNGTAWATLGGHGVDGAVHAMRVFDDGAGAVLHIGGTFANAGGAGASSVARWDGALWSAMGGGVQGAWSPPPAVHAVAIPSVEALAIHDDGTGAALFAGGTFFRSPAGDAFLAKWRGCPPPAPVVLPGCHGNAATLALGSGTFAVGRSFALAFGGAVSGDGWALLFVGADGTDAFGCGTVLPGIGDWLIAPLPGVEVGSQASIGGATFPLAVPASPAVIGMTVTFQAAHVALFVPGTPLEFSKGLRMTVGS